MAEQSFDVFLSYNKEERNSVATIARYLRDTAGFRPWFDPWEAIPGMSVTDNLKQGLEASTTCAVFIGKSGEGPWQKSEIRKAIDRQKERHMLRVIPVLLPDAPEKLDTSSFLLEFTWVDFRGKALNDDHALWCLECGIRGMAPGSGRPAPSAPQQQSTPPVASVSPSAPETPLAEIPTLRDETPPPPTTPKIPAVSQSPEKRVRRWSIIGVILIIAIAGFGGWTLIPKPPQPKPTPTSIPTIAPTQTPEPTPTLSSSEGTGVGSSCWENETPGATCKEDATGMEFVYVPGGEFWMGCGENEQGCDNDEKPRHPVTVKGFWMGKYEVTQAQWKAVMGKENNPSAFNGANRPVESVSWNDAQAFLKKFRSLGDFGTLTPRLPSEAEWEYAARAGTTTPFYFGETISTDQANYDGNYTYGSSGKKGVYRGQTTDVGSFPPNAFGLYDMHGNVWEWCQDTHGKYGETPTDGSAFSGGGSLRVLRGGGWNCAPRDMRSADRHGLDHAYRDGSIGFRLVRTK